MENNGYLRYQDFHLKKNMNDYLKKSKTTLLVPPKKELSETFFERNPDSKWKGKFRQEKLKWESYEWKNKKCEKK